MIAGGGGKGSREDFFKMREIILYLYANGSDSVEGENWQSNIYTKLYSALAAGSMGDFCFLLCAFPLFSKLPNMNIY